MSSTGAIDWFCVPRFDGEPLFGRLVGGAPAGTFRLGPVGPAPVAERRYNPHTATLVTTWQVGEARLTLTEGMVADVAGRLLPTTLLVRRLSAQGTAVDAAVEFDPRHGERHRRPGSATAERRWCANGVRSRCPWPAVRGLASCRASPPRSRSRPERRSPSCWPWRSGSPSSTSTRPRPGTCWRGTRPAGAPGRPRSTSRFPSATPWSAAC
ncbi:trehalase-like domain-containing protein [Phytohabitans flavus]|uniref:trehalase-like domain-containing protein n=1 Tax=Phytohabitans flavus TaxID=1076124 RepID=UPI001E342578